jgi:hypothetical protein
MFTDQPLSMEVTVLECSHPMACPKIADLPSPPHGQAGWPWTEALTARNTDWARWPRISLVTPSFNQARFLEATIRSVLLQSYPDLEYFVIDGGSTDGSVDVIKKYAPWITHWVSERDSGQSAAINRGLRFGSGEFAAWINSDDMLGPSALVNHATRVGFDPGVVYIGDCQYIDEQDRPLSLHRGRVHNFTDLVSLRTVWRDPSRRGHIVQPEVLFPRQLALDAGGLNESNHRTMDYELWGRLLLAGARFEYTKICFGMFRIQSAQKTAQGWATTQSLVDTALRLVARAPSMAEGTREGLIAELRAYERSAWLETGPLARLGLPSNLVLRMRELQSGMRRGASDLVRRAGYKRATAR